MLDVSLIFKIGAVGILMVVLDKVLKSAGKDEFAVLANLTGVVIVLMMVANLISQLFGTVKTLFRL